MFESDLPALYEAARKLGLAQANIGLFTDMIACPGGDFCSLANARSLHIAHAVTERYQDLDELLDIGPIDLHMSGCINSAAATITAAISAFWASIRTARVVPGHAGRCRRHALSGPSIGGKVVGPAFTAAEVPDVIEAVLQTYRKLRQPGEYFIDALRRIGHDPFKRKRPMARATPALAEEALPGSPVPETRIIAMKIISANAGLRAKTPKMSCKSLTTPTWPRCTPAVRCRASNASSCSFRSSPTGAPTARPCCCAGATNFTGDIRATGDVLIDQLVHMHRSGFTSAVLGGVDGRRRGRAPVRPFCCLLPGRCERAAPALCPGGRMVPSPPAELDARQRRTGPRRRRPDALGAGPGSKTPS